MHVILSYPWPPVATRVSFPDYIRRLVWRYAHGIRIAEQTILTLTLTLTIDTIKGVGLATSGDDVTNYVQIQRKAAILFDLIAATVR